MLAAIVILRLSIEFEWSILIGRPIFENSAGSPVASFPIISENGFSMDVSWSLVLPSSINGYSLFPGNFAAYSSNDGNTSALTLAAAPMEALMTFGSKWSTAGGMIARSLTPNPRQLLIIVPMLPAFEGLTSTMWLPFLICSSFFSITQITKQFSFFERMLNGFSSTETGITLPQSSFILEIVSSDLN